ncbi:MAG: alpha/beta fold hydrolase [Bacteroidia bacterium]
MPRILLFSLIIFFTSCDPYHFALSHVDKKARQAGLHYHVEDIDGYTISYWDSETDEPPLILVQGLGADAEFHWYKQLKALKNYRIIMPDLLYFGKSCPPKDNYSPEEQVKAIGALIRRLDLKKYDLCGFSYGGLIAAEIARKQPEKIHKLVLFDAPVKFFVREELQPLLEKFGYREPSQLLVPQNAKAMKNLTSVIYKHPPHIPVSFYKSFQENMYAKNAEAYKNILRTLEQERKYYETQEYHFQFPVLLVWGENDIMVPSEVGKLLESYIGSNAKLYIVKGTAHVPNLEKPTEFNRILTGFLEPESSQNNATSRR